MKERILDRRTHEPVNYSDLEREVAELAGGDDSKLPSAEREVAQRASRRSREQKSIARRLRDRRRKRGKRAPGSVAIHPPPGYGVFATKLQDHAAKLESELTEMANHQRFSRVRLAQIKAQAKRLRQIATSRFEDLDSMEEEPAAEMVRPFLRLGELDDPMEIPEFLSEEERRMESKELDELDPAMDASVFVSEERRQLDLVLLICRRLLDETKDHLKFIK